MLQENSNNERNLKVLRQNTVIVVGGYSTEECLSFKKTAGFKFCSDFSIQLMCK